jgi:hypothetical protein
MKRHEQLVKSEFDVWLARKCAPAGYSWEDVSPNLQRPDWFLSLGGRHYAVEATTVVPPAGPGPNRVLEPTISASLDEFVNGVEARARAEGVLAGAYVLSLCPLPRNPRLMRALEAEILEYVRATQSLTQADPVSFGHVGDHDLTIRKVHSATSYIAEIISYPVWGHHQIRAELVAQVHSALDRKARLLANTAEPILLLVLDAFMFSEEDDWRAAVSSSPSVDHFAAIYVIRPGSEPLLLYADLAQWPLTEPPTAA